MRDDKNQGTQITISKDVFNDSFYPLLFDYENRWEIYKGGSGSGKSHFIAQKLVIKALNDKRRVVICRRYGSTIMQTVWANFTQTLMFFQIYDRCSINKTERTIQLPNGSELIFMGLR